jgi:hypothetical protein
VSVALLLLLLGVLDRAAWFVAFERQHYTYVLPVLLAIGFATARTLAVQLPTHEASTAVSGRLLSELVEYAGWILFGLLAVFWVALVYRGRGDQPVRAAAAGRTAVQPRPCCWCCPSSRCRCCTWPSPATRRIFPISPRCTTSTARA